MFTSRKPRQLIKRGISLQRAFENNGLIRKVGLFRTLVTTQLNSCSSVDEYVNRIITTAHKLDGIGFKIPDEWVGTLLIAGLPEEYLQTNDYGHRELRNSNHSRFN